MDINIYYACLSYSYYLNMIYSVNHKKRLEIGGGNTKPSSVLR